MARTKQTARKLTLSKKHSVSVHDKKKKKQLDVADVGGVKKRKTSRRVSIRRKMIKEQRKLTPAIQKATFARVVKQIVGEKSRNGDLRIQKDAIVNLQRVAEDFIIERMRDSDMVAQVCGKWTLQPEHMDVARRIKALPGEKNAPTIDLGTSAEDATQASE
mgnify:CR=1 FL=1